MNRIRKFLDTAPASTKFGYFFTALLIVILASVVGVIGYYAYSDANLSVQEVQLANRSDTAITITWTSDVKYIGKVYYQESTKPWPRIFAQSGRAVSYDDRDVELSQEGEYVTVAGGTKRRYTHHVTLRNLKPDTEYSFRMGGRINGHEASVNTFKTLPLIEDLKTPEPGYGQVEGVREADAIILIGLKEPNETNTTLVSAPLERGTYSIDMNFYNLEEYDGSDFVAYIYTAEDKVAPYEFKLPGYKPFEKLTLAESNQSTSKLVGQVLAQGGGGAGGNGFPCVAADGTGLNEENCVGDCKITARRAVCVNKGEFCGDTNPTENDYVQCRDASGTATQDHYVANLTDSQAGSGNNQSSTSPSSSGTNTGSDTALTCNPNPCSKLGSNYGESCGNANTTDNAVWCERNDHRMVRGYSGICYKRGNDVGTPSTNAGCTNPANVYWENSDGSLRSKGSLVDQTTEIADAPATIVQGEPGGVNESLATIPECSTGWINDTNAVIVDATPGSENERYVVNTERFLDGDNIMYMCKASGGNSYVISCGDSTPDGNKPAQSNATVGRYLCTNNVTAEPGAPSVNIPEEYNACADIRPWVTSKVLVPEGQDPSSFAPSDVSKGAICKEGNHLYAYCTLPRLQASIGTDNKLSCSDYDVPSAYLTDGVSEEQPDPNSSGGSDNDQYRYYYFYTREGKVTDTYKTSCLSTSNQTKFQELQADEDNIIEDEGEGEFLYLDSTVCEATRQKYLPTSSTIIIDTLAQSLSPRGNVLGAAANSLEATESGRYVFFRNNEVVAEQDVVVVGDKVEMRLFTDTNGNGIKDEGEEYFQDYTNIKLSKQASAESFSLNSGWNLLHLPLVDNRSDKPVRKAGDLIDYWNKQGADIKHVARFANGQFELFSKRESGTEYSNNFNLIPGQGLFVLNLGNQREVVFSGNKFEESIPLTLSQGWNLIGVVAPGKTYNSEQLLKTFSEQQLTVSSLSQFENGLYKSVVLEDNLIFGNNFNVIDKRGYFIKVEEGGGKKFTP